MLRWTLWMWLGCGGAPADRFDADTVPTAPDYTQDSAWTALPETLDNADLTPPKMTEQQKIAAADVFYVHPTTWFGEDPLNADPLADGPAKEWLDQVLLAEQASVLNGCCRIYAPRYRQATGHIQRASEQDAQAALSIAYDDVKRAFDEFLARTGDRPFLIASHEQGSLHAQRLLAFIDGEPDVRERLVVAYIPGYAHPLSRFGSAYQSLVPCDAPTQVGCIASWDTYADDAATQGTDKRWYWNGEQVTRLPIEAVQCTNPVSWAQHSRTTQQQGHKGAVRLEADRALDHYAMEKASAPLGLSVSGISQPEPALLRADCEHGFLSVSHLDPDWEPETTTAGNYHLADYDLFAIDIRVNAWMRVLAWSGRKQDRIRAGQDQ